jgi:hypothetical protein
MEFENKHKKETDVEIIESRDIDDIEDSQLFIQDDDDF